MRLFSHNILKLWGLFQVGRQLKLHNRSLAMYCNNCVMAKHWLYRPFWLLVPALEGPTIDCENMGLKIVLQYQRVLVQFLVQFLALVAAVLLNKVNIICDKLVCQTLSLQVSKLCFTESVQIQNSVCEVTSSNGYVVKHLLQVWEHLPM